MRHTHLINYTLYQTGWFACVLGAAWQRPLSGFAIAVALLGVHLVLTPERWKEAGLIVLATATGAVVEIFQIGAGTYRFESGMVFEGFAPPWLLAMWAQFATTFRYGLRGIIVRPPRALLFGALGGPSAFLAGERLGAVDFLPPLATGLVRLSLAWLAALALFSLAARRVRPDGSPALRYRTDRLSGKGETGA